MIVGNFSYLNDEIYTRAVGEFFINIQKIGPDIARLYFTNIDGVDIEIPKGTIFMDTLNRERIQPFLKSFFISWFGSYSLSIKDQTTIQISNLKQSVLCQID
jgi:hypothetical protein